MALSSTDFEFIRRLVLQRAAIVLEDNKSYLVEARLLPVARQEGLSSISDLVTRLRSSERGRLHEKVVEAMTTNETSFFRDFQCFESLRTEILPQLVKRRTDTRLIEIWCAASSTGQEPYSIAMIVKEYFSHLKDWTFRLIATDLSRDVLERARQGRYSQIEVNRGLPAPLLVKYFQKVGQNWQIRDDIRAIVEFRELNLIDKRWNVTSADIVFLRNVLIYFDVATKKSILTRVREILRPDGYLFLGGSETTMNLDDTFERHGPERSCCYRLRESIIRGK